MMGNLAADAAYVVLIPLAGVIFAPPGATRSPGSPPPSPAFPAAFRPTSAGPARCPAVRHHRGGGRGGVRRPGTANIAGNWYLHRRDDWSSSCR
jgi:aminobenzoyl-glutamate transport protein